MSNKIPPVQIAVAHKGKTVNALVCADGCDCDWHMEHKEPNIFSSNNDATVCKNFSWHLTDAGVVISSIWMPDNGKSKRVSVTLSQWLGSAVFGMRWIHRNGDRLDYRRNNLVLVPSKWSNVSSRAYAGNRYKGVSYAKRKRRWTAQITVNRKTMYLGLYADAVQAARAYDAAARKHFPDGCYLNNV